MEVGVVNITQLPSNESAAVDALPPSGAKGARGKKLTAYSWKTSPNASNGQKQVIQSPKFGIVNGYNGDVESLHCCEEVSCGKACKCLNSQEKTTREPLFQCRKPMTFLRADIPEHFASGKKKRVQSAKSNPNSENKPNDIGDGNIKSRRRPASAHTLGDSKTGLDSSDRPNENSDSFEPFIYGYTSKKPVSGSYQELARPQFPAPEGNLNNKNLIDDKLPDQNEEKDNRIPTSLKPLLPWLTYGVPQGLIGIDPLKCLVFLPSLCSEYKDLPIVPTPQHVDDELNFIEKILPAKVSEPKKYEHPWKKIPVIEWQCKHSLTEPPSQLTIYNRDGTLLHQSKTGSRNVDVVRKEIQELEDLMKGIGSTNGCSLVVKYQAEINNLQRAINKTLDRVEEIERRDREKAALEEHTDYFGLREFYQHHDEIMEQITRQHQACIDELGLLEAELNIDPSQKHFGKA